MIENLPKILSEQAEIQSAPAQALKKAFVEVDKALGKHMDASVSGLPCLTPHGRASRGAGDALSKAGGSLERP